LQKGKGDHLLKKTSSGESSSTDLKLRKHDLSDGDLSHILCDYPVQSIIRTNQSQWLVTLPSSAEAQALVRGIQFSLSKPIEGGKEHYYPFIVRAFVYRNAIGMEDVREYLERVDGEEEERKVS